jgi:hypothetical protein
MCNLTKKLNTTYLLTLLITLAFNSQIEVSAQKTISEKNSTCFELPKKIHETSGLIFWNNLVWTHNDDSDNTIYGINPTTGKIDSIITIPQLNVVDWEELQHDESYFYLGDFGNNYQGNRTNLRIYKVNKSTLQLDTINFSYPEQNDYSIQKPDKTSFDCEAFLVSDSCIYLFTKNWKHKNTTLYKIPNRSGGYIAEKINCFNSKGLITGATFHPSNKLVALIGYTKTLKSFIYLLYNFEDDDFLNGKHHRLTIKKRFLQTESVSFITNTQLAFTNERFHYAFIKRKQQLRIFDLAPIFQRLAIPID